MPSISLPYSVHVDYVATDANTYILVYSYTHTSRHHHLYRQTGCTYLIRSLIMDFVGKLLPFARCFSVILYFVIVGVVVYL